MDTGEKLTEMLRENIDAIPLIDTHEHIPPEARITQRTSSFFHFFEHYVSSDLVSAGMSRADLERMRDLGNGLSCEERWELMAPYWPYVRTTGYGQAMCLYMEELFGILPHSPASCSALCEAIETAQQPGWYATVFEKANIDKAMVITWPGESVEVDQSLFRAVPILDHFATPATRADLEALEKLSECTIQTLDQLLYALEKTLEQFQSSNIAAVKNFLAYNRPLSFERVSKTTASRCFDRLWLSSKQDLGFDDLKPLQDYVVRHTIALATDRGLPIQIHTGMQEGNGNYLQHSNPTLLTNLFLDFADARFDIFHAGFPYTGEVAVLAKNFANVWADLCWVHAISPTLAENTLNTWLEIIPTNKIFGFGGDSNYIEGAYGHSRVARQCTANVLTQKILQGYYASEKEALWVAQRILHDNACEFFQL